MSLQRDPTMSLLDPVKETDLYHGDPHLRNLIFRWEQWNPSQWSPEVWSLDIGYLLGLIMKLEMNRMKHANTRLETRGDESREGAGGLAGAGDRDRAGGS